VPTVKICTDTVTLYNYIGEANYVAVYSVTILQNVNVHMSRSSSLPGEHTNSATLCIFDQQLEAVSVDGVAKSFLPNLEWEALDADERTNYWTLDGKHAGKDIFVLGTSDSEWPTGDSYRIDSAERYNRGTLAVQHWKVVGR